MNSPLNWETCLPVPKRRRVAALRNIAAQTERRASLGSNKRLRPKFAAQPINEFAGGGSLCWLALAPFGLVEAVGGAAFSRSEERRVGEECRSRGVASSLNRD